MIFGLVFQFFNKIKGVNTPRGPQIRIIRPTTKD